jgi:hypothetical protein
VILKQTILSHTYIFLELKIGVLEKIVQNLSCSLNDFIFILGIMFTCMGLHIVTGLDYIYPVCSPDICFVIYFTFFAERPLRKADNLKMNTKFERMGVFTFLNMTGE